MVDQRVRNEFPDQACPDSSVICYLHTQPETVTRQDGKAAKARKRRRHMRDAGWLAHPWHENDAQDIPLLLAAGCEWQLIVLACRKRRDVTETNAALTSGFDGLACKWLSVSLPTLRPEELCHASLSLVVAETICLVREAAARPSCTTTAPRTRCLLVSSYTWDQ